MDATRKCLDMVKALKDNGAKVEKWRKIKSIRSKVKSKNRSTSQLVFKGRNPEKNHQAVKEYLELLKGLNKRFIKVIEQAEITTLKQCVLLMLPKIYNQYLETFIDQIHRRLLQGEQIPASEKRYSFLNRKPNACLPARQGSIKANVIPMWNVVIEF